MGYLRLKLDLLRYLGYFLGILDKKGLKISFLVKNKRSPTFLATSSN
jgi:hypothetical protein